MRIAILLRRIGNGRGAEQSMLALAEKISKDHTVRVFGIGVRPNLDAEYAVETVKPSSLKHTYIPVTVNRTFKFLNPSLDARRQVSSFDPDLVLSQHWLSLIGARLNATRDVPHVLFLHDYEFLTDYGKHGLYDRTLDDGFPVGQFNRAWDVLNRRVIRYIFNNTTTIISNSKYVSDEYAEHWNIDPEVVYPFVTRERVAVSETGEKIGHITPTRRKGVDITLDVAAEFPDKEFILVGELPNESEIRRRAHSMENVTAQGYIDDIRDLYRECRLLLAPSRWPEPYGIAAVEAGTNGIPTLCSGEGGLAEAVGHSDFLIESNVVTDYVTAIEDVLEDYQQYSNVARKWADSRLIPESFTRFKRLVCEHDVTRL